MAVSVTAKDTQTSSDTVLLELGSYSFDTSATGAVYLQIATISAFAVVASYLY